jgi:phosphatidylinositol alpha 1,6-mannosyltransferase
MSAQRLALFTDTFTPQVNGVARTLHRLVAECARRDIETLVVTPDDDAPAPTDCGEVLRWPSRPFWAYPQLRLSRPSGTRARDVLRRFRPTLVHAATPFGIGLSGRRAARALDVPLVTSYHTHFTAYLAHYGLSALNALSWPFLRWFHNGGRRTFVPTHAVAGELRAHQFRGLRVWGRGVDTTRFSPAHRSDAWRATVGASDRTLVVTYVGRLAPEKGLGVALTAVAPLLAAHPERLRVVLVGDGPAEASLRASAPDGVIFLGRREGRALAECYASSDVFLFPSTTETFGNVVLEALASGLAVVAHDRGPTFEFANARTACPVDVRRADAIAAALVGLLADPARRQALGKAGRQEALARSWDRVWDTLFADYAEALAQPGPASASPPAASPPAASPPAASPPAGSPLAGSPLAGRAPHHAAPTSVERSA